MADRQARAAARRACAGGALSARQVGRAVAILLALVFSKHFCLAGITSCHAFHLVQHFGLPAEAAQLCLFVFLAASAAGTFIGGPVGDRLGLRAMIWASILGALPFTLALPHVGLYATIGFGVAVGLVLSSAFSAIVAYAQELAPGRVGMVSGLFFGFAFGMGGVGAAVLGALADWTSIAFACRACSFLPLVGLLAAFLPDLGPQGPARPWLSSAGAWRHPFPPCFTGSAGSSAAATVRALA